MSGLEELDQVQKPLSSRVWISPELDFSGPGITAETRTPHAAEGFIAAFSFNFILAAPFISGASAALDLLSQRTNGPPDPTGLGIS